MKLKQIKFTILLIFLFILTLSINKVKAYSDNNDEIVSLNKIWTIKFNQKIELNKDNKESIKITDSKGNLVDVDIELKDNKKILLINPPKEGYKDDEHYRITINKNFYSQLNEKLDKICTKSFLAKKQQQLGNSFGNIINNGMAVSDGVSEYYCSCKGIYKLYNNKKMKISDDTARSLNLIDNYIYYVNYSDDCKIYKVRVDGSSKTKVSNNSAVDLIIKDKWIYYRDMYSNDIYKTKIDGSSNMRVNEDKLRCISLDDNYIYYIDLSNKLKVVSINGEKLEQKFNVTDFNKQIQSDLYTMIKDKEYLYINNRDKKNIIKLNTTNGAIEEYYIGFDIMSFNVKDSNIYFMSGNGVYKFNIDNKEINKLYTNNYGDYMHGLNIVGNYVYFQYGVSEGEEYIHRMKIDGTEHLDKL